MIRAARAVVVAAALLAAPFAQAEDEICNVPMLRGWPPGTENYGTAVETLFADGAKPALSLSHLPPGIAVESGLLLIPGADGEPWTLRYAEAEERVFHWTATKLELRVEEKADRREVPIPADLAWRLVTDWQRALRNATADSTVTTLPEGKEMLLFVAGDVRVSAAVPECGLGALLMEQAELLKEASDDGERRREKRWRKLEESLTALEAELARRPSGADAAVGASQ